MKKKKYSTNEDEEEEEAAQKKTGGEWRGKKSHGIKQSGPRARQRSDCVAE